MKGELVGLNGVVTKKFQQFNFFWIVNFFDMTIW